MSASHSIIPNRLMLQLCQIPVAFYPEYAARQATNDFRHSFRLHHLQALHSIAHVSELVWYFWADQALGCPAVLAQRSAARSTITNDSKLQAPHVSS
jgi:hypothetical protein